MRVAFALPSVYRPVFCRFLFLGACSAIFCVPLHAASPPAWQPQLLFPANVQPDARLSLNAAGTVALSGIDGADGFSKVMVSVCDIARESTAPTAACATFNPISFFGSTRQFSGAAINNAAVPAVLAADRVSGAPPVFFLRTWQTNASASQTVLGRSPASFNSTTGYFSLADDGTAAAFVTDANFNPTLAVYSGGGVHKVGFDSTTLLRPQIAAATGQIVITQGGATIRMYDRELSIPRTIAGSSGGYSAPGSQPGISEDGLAVAFAATKGGKAGIHVSFDAYDPAHAALSTSIVEVASSGEDGIADLDAALVQRVAVTNRLGTRFKSGTGRQLAYDLVTVVFAATASADGEASRAGLFSRDLLLRVQYFPADPPLVDVVARSKLSKVAANGDTVNGETLSGSFVLAGAARSLRAGDPGMTRDDEEAPLVAFTVIGMPASRVVRARRVCNIPAQSVTDHKQYAAAWGGNTMSGSLSGKTISQTGCQLTSATNIANFYTNAHLTPAQSNLIVGNLPFTFQGGQLCFPGSGTCNGEPQQLGFDGMPNGDLTLEGAAGLVSLVGGPQLEAFRVDEDVPLDSNGKWLSVPDVRDNVNDNPLSPVADFFACNQEPVIIRVPNCGVKPNGTYACTQHFVVSRGKGNIASNVMAGDNMTGWITDPGASNSDLHNLVGTRDRRNRFVGIRALTAAHIAGSQKGFGGFRVLVDSPVSLIITDPRGRRLGVDPVSGEAFAEIPYGEVVNDGINDPDSGAMHTETKTYSIGGPADAFGNVGDAGGGVLDGDYDIAVIGTGNGPYTLTVISEDVTGQAKRRFVTGTATTSLREHVFVRRASAAGSAVEVSSSNVPLPLLGDVLMNGTVNIDDVNAVLRRANVSAEGNDDPMDLDHDGRITALDARKVAVLCTKPRCAR